MAGSAGARPFLVRFSDFAPAGPDGHRGMPADAGVKRNAGGRTPPTSGRLGQITAGGVDGRDVVRWAKEKSVTRDDCRNTSFSTAGNVDGSAGNHAAPDPPCSLHFPDRAC